MQLIGQTTIDFLGRRKIFIALSLVLLLAGAASALINGGLKFGIDFKGGTLVYVKFLEEPDPERIRSVLQGKGLSVATLQPFQDSADSHELKIDLDLAGDVVETSGKSQVIETLREIYPIAEGKLDFNNTSSDALGQRLMSSQGLRDAGHSSQDLIDAADALVAWRDQAPRSGLVRDASELRRGARHPGQRSHRREAGNGVGSVPYWRS